MKQKKKEMIEGYIHDLEDAIWKFDRGAPVGMVFDLVDEIIGVFSQEIPGIGNGIVFETRFARTNAKVVQQRLSLYLINNEDTHNDTSLSNNGEPIIFLSHKSDDKKYGDALRNLIVGLGVKNNQLIYTSSPLHKIPLDQNIYEYLRAHINCNVFMIILWSDQYLESPACLNEMGAAWVTQADYTNIYTPNFSFGNPKYHQCAVDTQKMGAVLNGDAHCKAAMIEFKNKVQDLFGLEDDEQQTAYLLDNFMKEIS